MILDPGGSRPSSWRSHRACLEAIPEEATHLLVLQDDAWPCDGFAAKLTAAITERPDRLIAAFVPGFGHLTRQVMLARKRREAWLELQQTSFVPLVAIVYPAEHARAIPAYADACRIKASRADDAVVAGYFRSRRIRACATVPSLVEHRDELPSVMRMPHGRGASHRLAAWFADEDRVFT